MRANTATPVTGVADLPGVHQAVVDGRQVRFAVDADHLDAVMKYLGGFGISALDVRPPTLEELMLRHYGDREAA